MPGILKMNNSANGSLGAREVESKKRSFDGKMVNGDRNAARQDSPASAPAVGAPSSGVGVANGASSLSAAVSNPIFNQVAEEPPEIERIDSGAYHSLSKLIQRIAQECYNELYETLNQMSELKASQPNGNMTNGLGLPTPQDAELNKQKKLLILRFAHDNRAKFIKLLVLTEWGKKASTEVSQLINLFSWARKQNVVMNELDGQIEMLKMESNVARQSNPDIRTALEILGKKKAEWISDVNHTYIVLKKKFANQLQMGFIPPPPMTPDKALKLLRHMNTSLSTRLIVHEKIPHQLSKWRIGSGRVTFIVDGEFELDLMSMVEDTSDQLLFIDLRLLFSPAPVIAAESVFFSRLKMGIDTILKEDGLEKCFTYLHNFTLTHKIDVLATQANELLRAGWAGSLRAEFAHRVLWVQYWLNRPGKKSWIEIGVSSNRPKNGKVSWRGPPVASLTVRWFREGVQVKDVDLDIGWNNLSLERMVKRVIALHVGHLLRATQQNFNPNLITQATLSETDPSDCRLEVSVGSMASTTTLSIESVTGKYNLRPATLLSSNAENLINRSLETSASSTTITQLLARSLLESVQRYANQAGWQAVARQALRMEIVKAAVNLDVLRFALFWPRGWSTNWALAAIVDASGESWWIFEIGEKGSTILHAQKILIDRIEGRLPPLNRTVLSRIERVAVHQLSYSVTSRALQLESKTYSLRYELAPPLRPTESVLRGWVLHLKTSDLITLKPGEVAWLEPGMQVMCQGFRSDYRHVWHIATGTMTPEAAIDMEKLMSASPQNNITLGEGGKLSILLSTPFGQELVTELKARLRDLNRLRSFATTLQKRNMMLQSSSLEQVQFKYSHMLSVKVLFGNGADIQVKFGDKNPHNRIHRFLTDIINERAYTDVSSGETNALDRFCTTLLFTRPLLSSLTDIENRRPGNTDNPAIHSHALGKYRITYTNPPCSFDIRLRPKDDKVVWHIDDNESKQPDLRPKVERSPNFRRADSLKAALQRLFKESDDPRWWGVRTGIIAEIYGVGDAVRRLHEAVISCYVEGGVKQEPISIKQEPKPSNSGQANRPGAKQSLSGRGNGSGREPILID
ncbi:mediator complex subunit [Kalmusia sp. IMI 367209]|nr:mediator complex subunit [Kalmusia sp. IMI 367209]